MVDLLRLQARQQVIANVDTERVHASALQGLQARGARFQRHLALGALAAVEHGHATEVAGHDLRTQGVEIQNVHCDFSEACANSGLLSNCGARPPMSPAPWQSRMSPARSNGLTSGASSTPRSI